MQGVSHTWMVFTSLEGTKENKALTLMISFTSILIKKLGQRFVNLKHKIFMEISHNAHHAFPVLELIIQLLSMKDRCIYLEGMMEELVIMIFTSSNYETKSTSGRRSTQKELCP